jgi:hypothetical protein
MSIYIDSEGNYPRYVGDIYLVSPSWQNGDPLPQGWSEVTQIEPPIPTSTTYVYEDYPIEVDGVLSQNWVSRPYTAEELAIISSQAAPIKPYVDIGLSNEVIEQITGESF